MLVLEGMQAGLSWSLILKKRAHYIQAFDNFDATKIAAYDEQKYQELLADAGIIRNKLKIQSTIQNARAFLAIQAQAGSFDAFIWQFVDGRPQQHAWQTIHDLPAKDGISDTMSKELKRRGFNFVGTTICYSFMQAVGMVNDHIVDCFRWQEIQDLTQNE